MVGDNFLNRIKAGHSIQIKAPKVYRPLKEYADATETYSGKVRLGANGELLGYTAGQPFPKLDLSDAQIGQKLAWNFFWRWLGDDYKTGGAVKGGKIIRSAIEKDGAERRADLVSYFLFPRTRYNLDPNRRSPAMSISTTCNCASIAIRVMRPVRRRWKFAMDPNRADDLYIYIPSIRRIRRATTTQRCQTLAPSEFNLDDINSFNGKITDFNYKFLGEKKMLANLSQEHLPFARKPGRLLALGRKMGSRGHVCSGNHAQRSKLLLSAKTVAPQQGHL